MVVRLFPLASFGLVLGLAGALRADTPSIGNISPAGLPRGVATMVDFQGANLGANPRLVAPIPVNVEPPEKPSEDGKTWKPKLTVPAGVALGVYPVRIQTDDGISNPFLLALGQVPNVAEVEPNNTFEQAQAVALPGVIEGQLAGADVDFYKFTGVKGQKLLLEAWCSRIGSGIDPQIRLNTVGRKFIASVDDTAGLFTDARLIVELPEDGEYVVEFSDSKYTGGGRASYRLTMGSLPAVAEIYPQGGRKGETVGFEFRGGTLLAGTEVAVGAERLTSSPGPLTVRPRITNHMVGLASPTDPVYDVELPGPLEVSDLPELREPADPAAPPVRGVAPVIFNGRLDAPGDEDRFLLAVTPGQVVRIQVHAADLYSEMDGSLAVLNAANNQSIATGDDTAVPAGGLPDQPRKPINTTSADPSVDVTVPGGVTELALVIRDVAKHGGLGYPYRIEVRPAAPTFHVQLAGDPQVSIPKGGTVTVPVAVVRQGYNGPLTLNVANLPAGLLARAGQVSDGQPVGAISLSAAADAAFGPVVLDLQGVSPEAGGSIKSHGTKVVVFAQQGAAPANVPLNSVSQFGLAAAPAQPRIITLESPTDTIEAVHGYPASVPLKVARTGDPAKGELTVQPLPLPPGIAVPEVKIAAEAAEGAVAVNIAAEAAVGPVTLGFTAKGKFQDKDQVFGVPVVTLNVVRPVGVELATPKLEIKPGETIEVKGKVVRRAGFNLPLTLQINGLPAGLKAEPVTLAPEMAEFVLKVVAEANAAAAETSAQLAVATFKLADKDYNLPPMPLPSKVVVPK